MGMMKVFPILLTFYHKLVLRKGIFEAGAAFIPYFAIYKLQSSNALQTATVSINFYFIFCFLFCETRNMKIGCAEIFRQGKQVHNSRKL